MGGDLTICGDGGRGGYAVLPVRNARVWKWGVCWIGASLYYGTILIESFRTRQAAQACWRTKTPRFTRAQYKAWIDKLIAADVLN